MTELVQEHQQSFLKHIFPDKYLFKLIFLSGKT